LTPSFRYIHHPTILFLVFLPVVSALVSILVFFFFFAIIEDSIPSMCHNHLILRALTNLMIFLYFPFRMSLLISNI
jgi:hypothetical protein